MPPRKLDELAGIVDDAKETVEELQHDDQDSEEKLDDLHTALDQATDVVDELEEEKK